MIYNKSKYNANWEEKTLAELGEFNRGKSKHRPRNDERLFTDGKYPLVQTGDVTAANLYIRNHSATYNDFGLKQSKIWPEGTLCITIAANIAETALLGYPMCFPDSVVGFNSKPKETTELFMHYVFTYIKKAIQNSASGSIQDNINIEYLSSLKFRIPPMNYQNKIANILSLLDNKIEMNSRINSTLEKMAKLIYDYWFVQYNFPNTQGNPYKTSGGKMVWNDKLKRDVPQAWKVERLEQFGDFKNGINYDPKIKGDTVAKIINVRNISSATWFVSPYDLDEIVLKSSDVQNYLVADNDILIARSGIPGATRLISEFEANTIYCGFIIRYQINQLLYKNLLFFALKNLENASAVKSAGTIMQNINQHTLKGLFVAVPDEDTILAFNKNVEPIFQFINKNDKENSVLKELRDWLLPMLMNGQVKVS